MLETQKSRGIARNAAISAKFSARAARNTLATNREIERAYMAMSFRGLLFLERRQAPFRPDQNDDHPDTVDLIVAHRNVGRTPGDIVGGWCGFLYQAACATPKLTPACDSSVKLTRLFMLPNQKPLDFAPAMTLKNSQILFLRNGESEHGFGVVEGTDLPVTDPRCACGFCPITRREDQQNIEWLQEEVSLFNEATYGLRLWEAEPTELATTCHIFDPLTRTISETGVATN